MFPSYSKLYQQNNKYLSHKLNHYLPIYDRIIAHLPQKNEPVIALEIGVNNGGGLEILKKFLPEGSQVFGVDIDKNCEKLKFSNGITFILGDATDQDLIEKNFSGIEFDVIIDDGSHLPHHVIKSFELLFSKLKYGGLYIAEDVCTSYWKEYNGGFRLESSQVEYFKRLTDCVNFQYFREYDREKIGDEITFLENLSQDVASVTFYNSVIVVEKYNYKVERSFSDIVSQGDAIVNPVLQELERFTENSEVLDVYRKN